MFRHNLIDILRKFAKKFVGIFKKFSGVLRMIRNFATPGPSAADVRVVLIVVKARKSSSKMWIALFGRNPKVGRTSIENYGKILWWSSNGNRTEILGVKIIRQGIEGNITGTVFVM